MKKLIVFSAMLAIALTAAEAVALPKKSPIDFEKLIETAKRKVYPALVYVKPIRKDLSSGEAKQTEIYGSGVIISSDGLVVTNHHVAEDAVTIKCVLGDKRLLVAKTIGVDPETDLALLQLVGEKGEKFPFAKFANSANLEAGQFVLALGAPYGFTRSISLGIISNTGRYMARGEKFRYNTWIQTDAAINPGNSGGPLVDTEGRIVGINTLGIMGSGLGFSIPSDTVQRIVAQIRKDGKVLRAWTGVHLQPLRDFETNTFLPGEKGVLVQKVDKRSPAAASGLRAGDLLLKLNESPWTGLYVEQLPALYQQMADLPIGKACLLQVQRCGEATDIKITPTLKGQYKGDEFDAKRWNMTVQQISRFANQDLYFHRKQGVFIYGIRSPGVAQDAQFRRRDILVSIDGKPINGLDDFKRIYNSLLADKDRKKKVLIRILRGGYPRLIVLDYRRDYIKEEKE